ncbi:hypothetical protein IM792_16010 [Mucilaginibacter sp. JRF]|uniref:tetratricopeptide repeat protein n=1 Tax=Mucilaginibacter sp. JRF TaxID=2780088 RepID=UPI0018803587|nr:hypothetical protein [Mucilaginibacter sp. JRF]MBE9585959.1 hypothetical protein [Mucilaginibacter sp. JRF]
MKLQDIFNFKDIKIFTVTDDSDDDQFNWIINPTDFDLIPEDEGYYFVKAFIVTEANTTDCFLGILTPERFAEQVVISTNGQVTIESIYDIDGSVIPVVAAECFGNYELYYAKENPQIGIDILKSGLTHAVNKSVIAEDLGYILRDEGRTSEAIEAFKISEENTPSSEYIYNELAELYREIGDTNNQIKYEQLFNAGNS